MAIKQVDLTRLLSQLQPSKTCKEDRPLSQVIEQLIQQLRFLTNQLNTVINNNAAALAGNSFVTVNDDIANLPNSRRIIAGDHIEIDESIPHELIINSIPFTAENLTNENVIDLFRYAFQRLDMIEEFLGIDRTPNDILVPSDALETIQDEPNGTIGIRSMR